VFARAIHSAEKRTPILHPPCGSRGPADLTASTLQPISSQISNPAQTCDTTAARPNRADFRRLVTDENIRRAFKPNSLAKIGYIARDSTRRRSARPHSPAQPSSTRIETLVVDPARIIEQLNTAGVDYDRPRFWILSSLILAKEAAADPNPRKQAALAFLKNLQNPV